MLLHRPLEKIILDGPLARHMVKMHHYRSIRSIPQLTIPMISGVQGDKHYFHFILQHLTNLLFVLTKFPEAAQATLLVRKGAPPFRQIAHRAVLKKFPHLRLIEISPDERIDCDDVLLINDQTDEQIDQFAGGEMIHAVKKLYLEAYDVTPKQGSRLLYVSRRRQKLRRAANEAEVSARLEKLGFETICPELLPHEEQVRLFADARLIVATSGAALTNLLFCPKNCGVIEIRPGSYSYPLFLGLCKQLGLQHRHLKGSMTTGRDLFSVDLDELTKLVKTLLEQ